MYRQATQTITKGLQRALIGLIRVYRVCISPFFGKCCRFYPSCSVYAQEAIKQHGCFKGCGFAARRILKCHPFHPGGYDPVPPNTHKINT